MYSKESERNSEELSEQIAIADIEVLSFFIRILERGGKFFAFGKGFRVAISALEIPERC